MSAPLARRMAIVLQDAGADLGDERFVIRALVEAGYQSMQIADHMDDAIEIARRLKIQSVGRDGLAIVGAIILFILAWVALPGDAFAADSLARDAHVHAREGNDEGSNVHAR